MQNAAPGFFYGLALDYNPVSPGVATKIALAFTCSRSMAQDDEILLTLAGFTGTDKASTSVTAPMVTWGPVDAACRHDASSWTESSKLLKLVLNAAVPRGQPQTCAVETAFGVQIAASLSVNQPALTVAFTDADAECYNIAAAPVDMSPAVGPHATSLAFAESATDGKTAVTVKFANTVAMEQGDHAQVKLTDFFVVTGDDPSFDDVTTQRLQMAGGTGTHPGFDPDDSSWSESGKLLKLALNGPTTPLDAQQTVVVAAAVGIQLPLAGLAANQPTLVVGFTGTGATTTFSVEAPVQTSPATVTMLPLSSLQYSAANPSAGTAITLALTNRVQQQDNDFYEVMLADFEGASIGQMAASQLGVESAKYAVAECSWARGDKALKLKGNADVGAYTEQAFTIKEAAAIRLPTRSLAANDAALTVAFFDADAVTGDDIAAHSVKQSPARGLHATSLAFGAAASFGQTTAVTVKFTNSVAMA